MIAPTQIRKPENWQDFEKLCKKLWGEVWECSDTIQRNGRIGQPQHGVDIYGIPKGECEYYGIQCKGKDDYAQSILTTEEIDNEIKKALLFKPALKRLIFATTANKNVKTEEYIRIKNIENKRNGLFEVYLSSWEDIIDLLEERRDTYNWYINNCQYKDVSDIEIFVDWEKEYEVKPQYVRTTKNYYVREKRDFDMDSFRILNQKLLAEYEKSFSSRGALNSVFNPPHKVDYRWCSIPINIENTGATVIKDYKLYLTFESDKILAIDDGFCYYNDALMDQAMVAQINASKDAKREIFESSEYSNVIEFRPIDPILVQTDKKSFKVKVKPKIMSGEIKIDWDFKSQNYRKEGTLLLKVTPLYEDKKIDIEVEDYSQLKKPEVLIEPKMVEK